MKEVIRVLVYLGLVIFVISSRIGLVAGLILFLLTVFKPYKWGVSTLVNSATEFIEKQAQTFSGSKNKE